MLNFENLNGFVIDLTTDELCDEILEDILCGDKTEYNKVIQYSLQGKRDYIVKYFTCVYDYVFCKALNVYQIVEQTLCTYADMKFKTDMLQKRVDEGFQYAMEKDNQIEELKENIKDICYANSVLDERNNKLVKENAILKDSLQKINGIAVKCL